MSFNKKLLTIIMLLITNLLFCEDTSKDKIKVVLDKNQYESYFSIGSGIRGEIFLPAYLSGLGPEFSIGFNQKCGVGNNIELQYKGDINVFNTFSLFFTIYSRFFLPTILSNNDLIINIKLWNNEKSGLSIEPRIGLFGGWEFPEFLYFPYLYGHAILGLDIGVNLMGIKKSKRNNQKIYYGGSISIKEDFLSITTSYNDFLNNKYHPFMVYEQTNKYPKSNEIVSIYLPLMYFNTGFIIGWESRGKYIYKNEFSFDTSFGWFKLFKKQLTYEILPDYLAGDVSISFSYTFYFGKYYEGKK